MPAAVTEKLEAVLRNGNELFEAKAIRTLSALRTGATEILALLKECLVPWRDWMDQVG